jgi:CRISPR-associated protein Cas5d
VNKFVDMFCRRVEKGQHFQAPYFGCREFPVDVLPVTPDLTPIDETRDLGVMLWDIEFGDKNVPVFFAAKMVNGVIEVPPSADAARATFASASPR